MKHIIENFKPLGGKHCITASIRQIFNYNGYKISEEMLFGLGSGLGCFYGEFGGNPTFGGRCRIGEFEDNIASRLNIGISINKTASEKKAYQALADMIESDSPAMIYVDMPYLRYLNLPENAHFGGHSIVVFGIDEEENNVYVSDRDAKGYKITMNDHEIPEDYHILSLKDLASARGSKYRPYPPENKWVTFDFANAKEVNRGSIMAAIGINSENMLSAPVKTVGLKGIRNFSERVVAWKDFDDEKLKWAAFNIFIMISHVGGTGGGAFRKIYGNFLRESSILAGDEDLCRMGDEYYSVGEEWDNVGSLLYGVYETVDRTILDTVSQNLQSIYVKESNLMDRLKAHSLK